MNIFNYHYYYIVIIILNLPIIFLVSFYENATTLMAKTPVEGLSIDYTFYKNSTETNYSGGEVSPIPALISITI